jgi:phosphatidylglycerophosphate synthase
MIEHRAAGKLLVALTASRIALIPVIAASFLVSPAVTAVSLLVFMFADLFDGVIARGEGADGPRRRALDTTVDRIAIDVGLVAATIAGAMPLLLLAGFLARDLYCGGICTLMMAERRVAIKSDFFYRGLSCGFATWALAAPFISSGGRSAGAAALFFAALLLAVDLTRSVQRVRSAPASVQNLVLDAASLRRGEVDWETGAESRRRPPFAMRTAIPHRLRVFSPS